MLAQSMQALHGISLALPKVQSFGRAKEIREKKKSCKKKNMDVRVVTLMR